jgi:hypothetical protein
MAHLCLVLAALFVVNCSNHTATTSDTATSRAETGGFRGVKWNTPLDEMKSELVLVGNDDGRQIEWYKKENEELSLGAASLESIHYVFHERLFKRVAIVANGADNYEQLRDYFLKNFGEASKSTDGAHTWNLDTTTIMFAYNPVKNVSLVILQQSQNMQ